MYFISRIDSIRSYYLIYANKEKKIYKIVSKKESCSHPIEVGSSYSLSLTSVWTEPIIIDGIDISPSKILNVKCVGFDDSTSICLEGDSIRDLFEAKDLKGLCLE
jgi:hypothetical protein